MSSKNLNKKEKKPSERIKEIISTIDYGETNPALTAIVKYLDEQYEQENKHYANCDLVVTDGDCTCGVSKPTPKRKDKEQMDSPTMEILSEIAMKAGYSFLFGVDENVGDGVYLDVGYAEENPKEIYFQVCKDTPKHTDELLGNSEQLKKWEENTLPVKDFNGKCVGGNCNMLDGHKHTAQIYNRETTNLAQDPIGNYPNITTESTEMNNWEEELNELLVVYKLSEFSVSKEEIIQKVKSLLAKEKEEVIKMVELMIYKNPAWEINEKDKTRNQAFYDIINKLKENI